MQTAIRSCGLAAILLTADAAAGPSIDDTSRRIEVGADGPNAAGFREMLSTTGLERFNERVLGSDTINGSFVGGNASQFSSFMSSPYEAGVTGTGRVQLFANPSSADDRFAGLAVSNIVLYVDLASPGQLELFYNISASDVPTPGAPAMFAASAIQVVDFSEPNLPVVFRDDVDGSIAGNSSAGGSQLISLSPGRYQIYMFAIAGVFQGTTFDGQSITLPQEGVDLGASFEVTATVIPAPAIPLVLVMLTPIAARRRRSAATA